MDLDLIAEIEMEIADRRRKLLKWQTRAQVALTRKKAQKASARHNANSSKLSAAGTTRWTPLTGSLNFKLSDREQDDNLGVGSAPGLSPTLIWKGSIFLL